MRRIEREKNMIMKVILQGIVLFGLFCAVFTDIRERKISISIMLGITGILILLKYFSGEGNVKLWIASFGIGFFFYMVSLVTKEKIGKGDAFVFAMTGAGAGLWNNLIVVYGSFLCAFVCAALLLLLKKKGRNDSIPFAPCIMISYLFVLAGGVI